MGTYRNLPNRIHTANSFNNYINRKLAEEEDEHKLSLERSIEFLEQKMNDPKVYVGWKEKMSPQLRVLKKELQELTKQNE